MSEREMSALVRHQDKLFYTTDQAVIARNSTDGSLLWEAERSNSSSLEVTPVIAEEKLITAGSHLTAWDVESGDQIWDTSAGGSSAAPLTRDDDTIYITLSRSSSGLVKAFDIDSGEELWSRPTANDITSSVAVRDGAVYAVDDDGVTYRMEDGEQIWRTSPEGNVVSPPIVIDDQVIVSFIDGDLTAYDLDDGTIKWEQTNFSRIDFSPVQYGRNLILSNKRGELYSYDPLVGAVVWSEDFSGDLETRPLLLDDTLIVGTDRGRIIGFNASSGGQRFSIDVIDDDIVGLVGHHDSVHVTGYNGNIGGAYVSGVHTARSSVRELRDQINIAQANDISTVSVEGHLDEASRALERKNYVVATEEAESGVESITAELEEIETIQGQIDTVRNDVESLGETTPVDVSDVMSIVEDAEMALGEGDTDRAVTILDDAEQALQEREESYQQATDTIANLEAAIETARKEEIPFANQESRLESATGELEDGNIDTAQEIAADALQQLEDHIQTVRETRDTITELEELISQAESEEIDVSTGEELLAESQALYAAEDFEDALERSSEGVEYTADTIQTANRAAELIGAAESFSAIQPFVESLAEDFDSEEHLAAAQDAYQARDYDTALAEAEQARNAQWAARLIVDGGFGATAVGGYLFYRRGGFDTIAAYIADKKE